MYLNVRSGSSSSGLLLSFIKFVYFLLPNWFIRVCLCLFHLRMESLAIFHMLLKLPEHNSSLIR